MERKEAHVDDVERFTKDINIIEQEQQHATQTAKRGLRRVGEKHKNSSITNIQRRVKEMRRQVENDRRWVVEGEAKVEELRAVIGQNRQENQILVMENIWAQLLAHDLELLIFL